MYETFLNNHMNIHRSSFSKNIQSKRGCTITWQKWNNKKIDLCQNEDIKNVIIKNKEALSCEDSTVRTKSFPNFLP